MSASFQDRALRRRFAILAAVMLICLACENESSSSETGGNGIYYLLNALTKALQPANNNSQWQPGPDKNGPVHRYWDKHGPACPEAEGVYDYRWDINLDLMVNRPQVTLISGVINFHRCPGGGRVKYKATSVKAGELPKVEVTAEKVEGSGDLGNEAPEQMLFYINLQDGSLEPDLSQGP